MLTRERKTDGGRLYWIRLDDPGSFGRHLKANKDANVYPAHLYGGYMWLDWGLFLGRDECGVCINLDESVSVEYTILQIMEAP